MSMLRLQTVAQSTLFPKKKKPQAGEAVKTSARSVKVGVFDTVLAVCTLAVTFFFLRRTCCCRLSASLSSHLTPDQLVLSNTVLQPHKKILQTAQYMTCTWQYCLQSRIDRVSDHCMRWCVHRAFRRWSFEFGCRTCTRRDSISCVDNGFFLRVLSLDTSSSTYFPLFQLGLRPASTPDSNRR